MIALNATNILQYSVGGSSVETDDHSALMATHLDWGPNQLILTLSYNYGTWTATPPTLTPGQRAPALTVTLDLVHGGWTSSSGANGNLTAAQLTQINTALTQVRNISETFAVTAALLPGTQTPWS
jgi:hypothetical protein